MKKLVDVDGGEIFAIPLFLTGEKSTKSFAREHFSDKGKQFVYCRIIEDRISSGIMIEIFDLIGNLEEELNKIINSNRLFPPVFSTGIGIYKKRWKKIHHQKQYDKYVDSNYNEIKFVLEGPDDFSLWQNEKELKINEIESRKYEAWQIWMPVQLEKRIVETIFS